MKDHQHLRKNCSKIYVTSSNNKRSFSNLIALCLVTAFSLSSVSIKAHTHENENSKNLLGIRPHSLIRELKDLVARPFSTRRTPQLVEETQIKTLEIPIGKEQETKDFFEKLKVDPNDVEEFLSSISFSKFFANPMSSRYFSAVIEFVPGVFHKSQNRLKSLLLKQTPFGEIFFKKQENSKLSSHNIAYEKKWWVAETTIQEDLKQTVSALKLSHEAIRTIFRLLSLEVDFERELEEGQKLEVVYEKYFTLNGDESHDGNIIAVILHLRDRKVELFSFRPKKLETPIRQASTRFIPTNLRDLERDLDSPRKTNTMNQEGIMLGMQTFFHSEGRSLEKTLMKTPIPSAAISSNFGPRHHPLKSYTRLHQGIDFRAKKGTPILASGDGFISFRKKAKGYGLYVMIDHGNGLQTAYAHLSRFENNIHLGTKVYQGQVIGYVGSTGRATGPHLHYEILLNDTRIDPLAYTPQSHQQLEGEDYSNFETFRDDILDFLETSEANQDRS
jgi:murein DD-endopeptidase MepM/ murein hydrolase activator NlpD